MSTMKQKDIRPAPSLIEFKGMRFLITDRPSDVTIQAYLQELKKHDVCMVVRVCEPSYDTAPLVSEGIEVRDLAYDDGTFPPANVVDDWFEILRDKQVLAGYLLIQSTTYNAFNSIMNYYFNLAMYFKGGAQAGGGGDCVAGLGRAPVMVALALIELGMKYEEAVENIRAVVSGKVQAQVKAQEEWAQELVLRAVDT
ncbi:Protein tyrosine phosphatase type IVA 2 [Eumeta japonica]|uniref:Protein tyrosine phosphatase type IVA 2 n=1 Tax=Eumeta variegata TaxID=151549 RepID=A0A4C1ZVW7_EUMVA|nr:Protein tyrosine phosphatase type IVA 2 [Eumeta japonica]